MARVDRDGECAGLKSAQVIIPPFTLYLGPFILLSWFIICCAVPLSCIGDGDTLILIFAVTMDSYILLLAI